MIVNLFLKANLIALCCLSAVAMAASAPHWKINPATSSLQFTATQNNAPVSGQFKTFTGDIVFSPTDLTHSHVKVSVDMGSVNASYNELVDTLKSADWFDASVFPHAVFESRSFTKVDDTHFIAKGTLTVRDQSVPVVLQFTFNQQGKDAKVVGFAELQRNKLGVGQGDWKKTDEIKDDVKVDFVINASN